MLANLQHNVSLWLKEKTGLTAAVLIFGCMTAIAASWVLFFFVSAAMPGQQPSLALFSAGLRQPVCFWRLRRVASPSPCRAGVGHSIAPSLNGHAAATGFPARKS